MSCVKVELGARCTLLRYQIPRGPLTVLTDIQLSCHHTFGSPLQVKPFILCCQHHAEAARSAFFALLHWLRSSLACCSACACTTHLTRLNDMERVPQ